MSLFDSESLTVVTRGAADSLPDPTLWDSRTHELVNAGTSTVTWSSVGPAPFVENGVNVPTISIGRGESKRVHSDGTHWIVKAKGGGSSLYADTAVTDAAGNAVFGFPPGFFSAAPVAGLAVQFPASSNPIDYRITALSASSCTVNVRQSPALIVLSLSVLGVAAPLPGVTVHLTAGAAS